MKIGLLSLPRYYNYGSQLQLFALQTAIEREGYACEVIDYDHRQLVKPLGFGERLARVLRRPSVVTEGLSKKWRDIRSRALVESREAICKDFERSYIKIGGPHYDSLASLMSSPPVCDAFVVGSDQLWSPLGHLGDDTFFLAFAPPDRRIAYAPSLGVEKLAGAAAEEWIRHGVSGMPFLSVREDSGAAIIKQLTGRDAEVVVDPTMLLTDGEWADVAAARAIGEDYVLMYALAGDRYIREYAQGLAAKLNCRLVILPFHPVDMFASPRAATLAYDVGPKEFLSLIRHARAVCTDSFHGTVFSVIFSRQFLVFRRYDDPIPAATFSRMTSLLTRIGLESRIRERGMSTPCLQEVGNPIDGPTRLQAWREKSGSFLAGALHSATRGLRNPLPE